MGQEFEIKLEISGIEAPEISVLKNKREFKDFTREPESIWIRKSATTADAASYEFTAVNSIGKATATVTLQVVEERKKPERPTPPQGPILMTLTDPESSVRLEWLPPVSDGGSAIVKYTIEKHERGHWIRVSDVAMEINSYVVNNLLEGEEYFFRILAENKVGASEWLQSDVYKCFGVIIPPPEAPFEILGMSGSGFTLRWQPAEQKIIKIKEYVVERREEGKKAWVGCGSCEACWMDVGGLRSIGYEFRVCSVGWCGRKSVYVGVREGVVMVGRVVSEFFLFYFWLPWK